MSFISKEKRRIERKVERYVVAVIAVLAVSIISKLGYGAVAESSNVTEETEVAEQVSEINDIDEAEVVEETVDSASDVELQEATLIRVVSSSRIIWQGKYRRGRFGIRLCQRFTC